MREPSFMSQNLQQPPMLFQAQEPVEITLTAQEWNVVLAGLYELPFRMVEATVGRVRMQLNAAGSTQRAGMMMPQQREQI
jgi:hypothetical protein